MIIKLSPIFGVTSTTAGAQCSDLIVGWNVDLIDAAPLTGSEKQVAWADSIRAQAIRDYVMRGFDMVKLADESRLKHSSFLSDDVQKAVEKINSLLATPSEKLEKFSAAQDWIDAAGGALHASTVFGLLQRAR